MRLYARLAVTLALGLISSFAATANTAELGGDAWPRHTIDNSSRGADGVRLADVNGDRLVDVITGWEEGGVTRLYINPGAKRAAQPWPAVTVGKSPSVEDAVFADLDGDGNIDVITSCEGNTRTIFIHWAPPRDALTDPAAWKQVTLPDSKNKMAWMYALPAQVDGQHGLDIVAGGKEEGAALGWFESPAEVRSVDGFRWHAISSVGWLMSLESHDMDGDGDEDFLISDRRGPLRGVRWLENPGTEGNLREPWRNHFVGAKDAEVMFLGVADIDQDGLKDIIVAVKPAEILWCRRLDTSGDSWETQSIAFPNRTGTAKSVAAGDLDGDGRLDLAVSCEKAAQSKSGIFWLRQHGPTTKPQWEPCELSGPKGIKFDLVKLLDLNGDQRLDLLTCEEREGGGGLGVIWYENPH